MNPRGVIKATSRIVFNYGNYSVDGGDVNKKRALGYYDDESCLILLNSS